MDSLSPNACMGPTTLASAGYGKLSDGQWHTLRVSLKSAALTVSVDGTQVLGPTALTGFTSGQTSYFGFAGATGGKYQRHEFRNFTLTVPTTRCL